MDIRYKSFVPRSKQDHRFDQLLQASSVNKPSYDFSFNKSIPKKDYSNFAPKSPPQSSQNRKKVNVITFTPDDSNELVSHVVTPNINSNPSSEVYKSSSSCNLPSILRTSRSTVVNDNFFENNSNLADSASKLMAAKRKAAKEVVDTKSYYTDPKKRYSPISLTEFTTKRAVSPEVLRPEPEEHDMFISSEKQKWLIEPIQNLYSDNEDINSLCQTQICNSNVSRRLPSSIPLHVTERNNVISHYDNTQKVRPMLNSKKSKVLYNPRPWQDTLEDDDGDNQYRLKSENIIYRSNSDPTNNIEEVQLYDFDNNEEVDCSNVGFRSLSKSKSEISYTQNSRGNNHAEHVNKANVKGRGRYSLLESVKEAYECQETGETQDLLDDVDYLIEGLKSNLSSSTRTLGIITLTGKCMVKSFRDLLKAHGLLTKVFKYLEDAYLNESVAMCTAALFLVFSRDKQPRIFDDSSLGLLLKLPRISKNQTKQSKENERVRDKIRLLLNKFHQHSNEDNRGVDILDTRSLPSLSTHSSFQRSCSCCRHLKLDNNITTEDLVVECLLQFSSRKCPDWFKILLRKQHGLDLICDQVTSSVEYLGSDLGPQSLDEFVMDRLYRLFNYMRFFEHMTFQNRDNQSYLVDYNEAVLVDSLLRCLKLCASNLSYQPEGSQEKRLIQSSLLANLRLLANISHDNEYTSNLLGSCPGLLRLIFSCLLHLPRFMSISKRFDLSVLALALLINLVEHCSENRRRMAHVSVSRKRVACLGKSGQMNYNVEDTSVKGLSKSMEFSFDDEVEDEDMDLEEEEDDDPNEYINVDCESSDTKINILEALVKLFLRHDDRAKNNTLIEGEEEQVAEVTEEGDMNINGDGGNDPKWRLVADRTISRKNKSKKTRGNIGRDKTIDLTDSEDDCSSEEGADVEFMISSKEEEEELQKKLSAAGQHMQDSVVSAYAALLLGCIIKSSHHYMERIRLHLPLGKFKILAFVLAKFLSILSLTSGMGHTGEESILEIVRLLEAQDQVSLKQITDDDDLESSMMTSKPLCRYYSNDSSSTLQTSSVHVKYSHGFDYNNEDGEDEEDSSSILSS